MYNFDDSFRRKSPIYYDVFRYIESEDSNYRNACMKLRQAFFDDVINLEELYTKAASKARGGMEVVKQMWEDWKSTHSEGTDEVVRDLTEVTMIFRFLYLNVQKELLLYNAVLNKVFFQEKMEELLSYVNKKEGTKPLKLLALLDGATDNQYMSIDETRRREGKEKYDDYLSGVKTKADRDRIEKMRKDYSVQKKSERMFSVAFEMWDSLAIDIRAELWRLLEIEGKCPKDFGEKYCIYNLLPYVERKVIPELNARQGRKEIEKRVLGSLIQQ